MYRFQRWLLTCRSSKCQSEQNSSRKSREVEINVNFHKKTKVNDFLIKHFQILLVIRSLSLKRISISFTDFSLNIHKRVVRMSEKDHYKNATKAFIKLLEMLLKRFRSIAQNVHISYNGL